MPPLQIRPFDAADIPAAAALLAERHKRHRQAQPLLSARYESTEATEAEVKAAFAAEGASGAVAVRGGRLVGYLLGTVKNETWGPNVWVESAGQAVIEAEEMRDLYRVAATRWVEEGRTAQYVLVPASDVDLVRAWFRLGFGHQHSHGLRPVPPVPPAAPNPMIRRAERRDIDVLAQLEVELPRHQGRAPVFSAGTVPTYEETRAEWAEDFDNPEYATFVAERDGRVIGSAIGCSLEKSSAHIGLNRPDHAGFLGFAAVLPEARGHGAGRALGEAVIDWAASSGYHSVATDWRVTNLLSSRTWPRLGFVESFVRLHRLVGY